jgi:1-acyl-sn-glycerol-3-phosphate acyltransferase
LSGKASQKKPFPKFASVAVLRSALSTPSRVLWRPRLIGIENFPSEGPAFLYGNHSNRWDPFIINCFTRTMNPTAGVMTREFFRSEFVSRAFASVGILPTSKRLAEPFLVRQVLQLLRQNRTIVIFPEGGSRWDGTPLPWMEATVKLFVRTGVPIHPVKIHGSYWSWPRWADNPRTSRVIVEALPPFTFARDTPIDEATTILRAVTDFDESVESNSRPPSRAFRPAAGIHRLLYRDPWEDSGALSTSDGYIVRAGSSDRMLRMRPDSSLEDLSSGVIYTATELYRRIRSLPLVRGDDGALLTDDVAVFEETEFPNLIPVGPGNVRLFDDRIEIDLPTRRVIPLEDVIYCDIERNFKLQLYLRGREIAMLQFSFMDAGSALQWKDALGRIRPDVVKVGTTESTNDVKDS